MAEVVVGLFPDQFLVVFLLCNRLVWVAELQENAPGLPVLYILYSLAEDESHACLQGDMHIPVGIHSTQGYLELRLDSLFCVMRKS